ncbi:MAG: ATP-binding cassette domain-containing protein [Nocardioidaceae bacterium]
MSEATVGFEDVVVERRGRRVLDGTNASFGAGRITVLAGPSGSGKTTMLRLVNRLDVPDAGTVRYRGADVAETDVLALRRRVGMVFQRPTAFPGTVRANLAEAAADKDDSYVRALELAALSSELLDRDTAELSGGELQRVCLARTLVTEPETLLLDEPTSSLDSASARDFERAARRLADEGTTILWVTHDEQQLSRIADVVVEMRSLP